MRKCDATLLSRLVGDEVPAMDQIHASRSRGTGCGCGGSTATGHSPEEAAAGTPDHCQPVLASAVDPATRDSSPAAAKRRQPQTRSPGYCTSDGGRRTEDRCWVRMHKAGVLRLERPSCGFVSAGLADYCLIVGYWKDKGQDERGCVACVEDRPSRARRQIICCDPARRVRRCYADGVLRQRPQQCRVEWQ